MTNLHILIAEDDPDDGEIMLETFSKHDAFSRIDLVKNGFELLEYLRDENVNTPDVILTDINMPILSGIEALEKINADTALKAIPAFVYSSTLNPAYQVKCMSLGTKAFLVKPLNMREFDAIPKTILQILEGETL
ncbi:MAG TPA: response regulator [Flavobacterium sp.]|jgi:CheY-like chemotaxis protein